MALINLTLQGKGGVGKSLASRLMCEYYQKRGVELKGFDTDPVNQTFGNHKAFPVDVIQLGERPDEINPRYFDNLIEKLMPMSEDSVAVIDNGSSTFLPLLGYLVESQVLEMLREAGHEVRLHSVITGGQAITDTMTGLAQTLTYVPDVPVVVWINEYFGRVERSLPNGKKESFEGSALYKNNKERIISLVTLPEVRKETFGHDIEQMMQQHLSFEEACVSESFTLMSRQRLKTTWRALEAAMAHAGL